MAYSKPVKADGHNYLVFEDKCPKIKHLVKLPNPEEVLMLFLRCSGCQRYEIPAVAMCKNGHPICNECFEDEELSFCIYLDEKNGICQSSFLKNCPMGIHTYLHRRSNFYCPNRSLGCPEARLGAKLKTHLDLECQYRRLTRCVFTKCRNMDGADLADYEDHLVTDHGLKEASKSLQYHIMYKYEKSSSNCVDTKCILLMNCHGAKFMVVMHSFEQRMAMWVSVIRQPPGLSFKATFVLPQNRKTEAKLSKIQMPVKIMFHEAHQINMPVSDIIDLCECVDFSRFKIETRFLEVDESDTLIWPITVCIDLFEQQ